MQIQINLHPERGRKRRRGSLPAPGAAIGRVLAPIRDKYLVGAVVAVAASCAGVAVLHLAQEREATALAAQEQAGVRDSAHLASVIAARTKVLARRDSLGRELRVIAAIDSTRYTWAHVLDEVSDALPPYTWLTSVQQTSAPPAPPGALVTKPGAAGAAGAAKPAAGAPAAGAGGAADTASNTLRFRIVGQTVDLQALTQFMRDLEASPYVRNVQLAHSEPVAGADAAAGHDLTSFTLDAEFERPSRDAMRLVTITVPVR
jgi:Tfp pilus assembly protein PilN